MSDESKNSKLTAGKKTPTLQTNSNNQINSRTINLNINIDERAKKKNVKNHLTL